MNRKVTVLLMLLSLIIGVGGTYSLLQLTSAEMANGGDVISLPVATIDKDADMSNEDLAKIEQVYKLLATQYVEDIDEQELIEGAINGMIEQLEDPFSSYMDEETAASFSQNLSSTFEGIGAEVSMVDGLVTIVAPYKDSPAEKAGLKPNDQILSVDGESIAGLDLYEAVLKIRGEKGSTVTLEIKRPGVTEPLMVDVVRDEIPIETVYSDLKEYEGKKVGYIEIALFSEKTSEDFFKQLKELEKQKIDGLVIDVRGNPGGYLQSVEAILRELVPKDKPMLQIEDRNGETQRFFTNLEEKKPYPIVSLIDEGSASASEILSSALKEAVGYDVVGTSSFGKGTVQQTVPMDDGSEVKLTMFKWLTSDGNWIHKTGVEPTVEIKQPDYFYVSPIQLNENEVLAYDQTSEKVVALQKMLSGLGYGPGREDGYFSEETKTAVEAFQKANDLPMTGKVDEQTAVKLETKIIERIRSEESDLQLQTALKVLFK
ncbi:PDZ domain-containing protein [Bacillus sp. HMF5848]|uniref:S41 family peptidase n=1 Tax=Bacillus sp. HMF5848 TaxID=2495421 RepID=UPI000F77BD09|nr:S41 family peptidase [Bacillus sp. HMF5848]RSK28597.1 PDZ domain-containing protein [Bacillus sp. HMF5848]